MIVIAIGIPIGLVLSQYIVDLIAHFHSNESFQVPSVIEPRTFATAALIVLLTGLASTYILRRQVYALDLVAVLKTSE